MSATAITDAITTLAEAEQRFDLHRTEAADFFSEWYENLPDLNETETIAIDELRRRYLYQRTKNQLLEGTVMLLLTSPLLAIAGFYDPPFKVRAEESVRLILDDGEEILQGRIDVLVLQDRLWFIVLESKKTALSVWSALPQTLAYLIANPKPDLPCFGMMTNGDEILFMKLKRGENLQYDVSRVFAPFSSARELYSVLQILKRIGGAIGGLTLH